MIKLIIIIAVILLFGIIGYSYKMKFVQQKDMYNYLKCFIEYYQINVDIYKNNIIQIIDSYTKQNNDKNAKFNKFFIKNNKIIKFNNNIIDLYIFDSNSNETIKTYLNDIGKNDFNNELLSSKKMTEYLNYLINNTEDDIKNKGDLLFKIWLAIGVLFAIIVW